MHGRYSAGIAVLFVSLLMTGCAQSSNGPIARSSSLPPASASSAQSAPSSPASTPPVSTSMAQTASASPVTAATSETAALDVTATDKDNGRTVTLVPGQRLRVVLASTYWTFQNSSSAAVLRVETQPHVNPQPSGCVPGAGCGTATVTYRAVAHGQTSVTASRTSCGEAMGCTGAEGNYSLRVVVS